ncbi:MAG: GNAT family N-acetyltransferase [Bacteroidia bacterium]|nr:GNAT family N-acetyltransferase [Bacteroidia bacterium]
MIHLRALSEGDALPIEQAFNAQGWKKPASQYERYFQFQEKGERDIILAEWEGEFAGYLTIQWISGYTFFKSQGIPEIVDLNVLQKFHRKGIASAMMDEAERRMSLISDFAGIGVGMPPDYGAAQVMYVRRGYVPDGKGLFYHGKPAVYHTKIEVDDGLVLYLTKDLRSKP